MNTTVNKHMVSSLEWTREAHEGLSNTLTSYRDKVLESLTSDEDLTNFVESYNWINKNTGLNISVDLRYSCIAIQFKVGELGGDLVFTNQLNSSQHEALLVLLKKIGLKDFDIDCINAVLIYLGRDKLSEEVKEETNASTTEKELKPYPQTQNIDVEKPKKDEAVFAEESTTTTEYGSSSETLARVSKPLTELRAVVANDIKHIEEDKLSSYIEDLRQDVSKFDNLFYGVRHSVQELIKCYLEDDNPEKPSLTRKRVVDYVYISFANRENLTSTERNNIEIYIDFALALYNSNAPRDKVITLELDEEDKNRSTYIPDSLRHFLIYKFLTSDKTSMLFLTTGPFLNDRNPDELFKLIYHMTNYDKYKNVISSSVDAVEFCQYTRIVLAVFVRHNLNLEFYKDTRLIECPPLLPDVWTQQIRGFNIVLDKAVSDGKLKENKQGNGHKLVDLDNIYKETNGVFNGDQMKFLSELITDLLPGDTTVVRHVTDRIYYVIGNKDKSKVMFITPAMVMVCGVAKYQVMSRSILHEYMISTIMNWITYFVLGEE